jgi:hypothetical protein
LFYLLAGLLLSVAAYLFTKQQKLRPFAVAFTLLMVVGLSSCGGGNNTSASIPAGTTTPETGLVTIVGTSGSLSNTITISVSIT